MCHCVISMRNEGGPSSSSSSGDETVHQSPTSPTQPKDKHAACNSSQALEDHSDATASVALMSAGGSGQTRTALPIVEVVVASCHNKVIKAKLMLDSGSDKPM